MNAFALALALLAAASDALPPPGEHRRRLADQLDLSRLEEAAGEGRLGAGISFKLDGSHKMSLAGEKSRLATAVARRMDCGGATRLFRDAGKHEAAQKAAGLDLWYAVRCAAADGDETKEAKSQKTLKRLRRFLDSESHDGVAFIEPELEKTLTREDIPGFLAEQDERRLEQTYQYRLIKSGAECNSGDASLGSFDTVKGCADKCLQTEDCRFFIYGIHGTQGDKTGSCWHEKTSDKTCSEGWESDSYDFYALEVIPARYRLIKANHECKSGDAYLGSIWPQHPQGCADKCAQTEGCRFFSYGIDGGTQGNKAGKCYHEKTSDAACSEGWESDSYDF
jgi:hypothetical protein